MKKVILDTNFILTCVKQKIDFVEDIKLMGMQILIPTQVIKEIERIAHSRKKLHFREDAKLTLRLLRENSFKKIDLDGKFVDKGLIKFAEKNKDILIATLDRELKNKIKNNKLIIKEKKMLGIV